MWLKVTSPDDKTVTVYNLEQIVHYGLKGSRVVLHMSNGDKVEVDNSKVPKQFGRKEQTLWEWLIENTVGK